MKRLLGLLLVMGMVGCGGGEEDPVSALEEIGARIKRNEQGEVTNVVITGVSRFTDAEMVHLKNLINLQGLRLQKTKVTDAGLVHLKGLINLKNLNLYGTKVTDAGLVHLRGLTNLQTLCLTPSQNFTDAGVAELQNALPNCDIR